MSRLRVRPLAVADVDHAAARLFEENPVAAADFLEALEREFEPLRARPRIGSRRYATLVKGLRMWKVGGFPYLVFYFEMDGGAEVVRVLHEARDLPAELRGTERQA